MDLKVIPIQIPVPSAFAKSSIGSVWDEGGGGGGLPLVVEAKHHRAT